MLENRKMSDMRWDRRSILGSAGSGVGAVLLGACAGGARAPQVAAAAGGPGPKSFPADFVWGTATASYQIEGAVAEDGRGPSVWDVFCKKPGAVFEGDNGDVACDHYHRHGEDVALLKKLGVRSYRFSLSWTRLLPDGRGRINEKGFDFYKRLLDELEHAGIAPMATLFHWDYPQTLFDKGGWLARDSAAWFADYASLAVSRLGDRVKVWVTQNEPSIYIELGHVTGVHAPGLKLSIPEALTAAHNSMRGHAEAVRAMRAAAKPGAATQIGCVFALGVRHPASGAREDLDAARDLMFAVDGKSFMNNAWWMDPVLRGSYPDDGLRAYGADVPKELEKEAPQLKQPIDFLGLNIYTSRACRRSKSGQPEMVPWPPGYPRSGVDWQPIVPEALYWGPRLMYERYGLPISITENGLSTRDQVFLDGQVHDPHRVDYLHRGLAELGRAIADGVPIRSYHHWSLLDNFEWADGYKQRFGLVYVDYTSLRRVPKDSFGFYQQVIATNGRSVFADTKVAVTQVTPT
jgi:beta-glucosidase